MYITIDGQTQAVTLVDNQATKTLVEKLQQTLPFDKLEEFFRENLK